MPVLPQDYDALVGWGFALEVDGVQIKAIQEISGASLDVDVIEIKQNTADGKYVIKKAPGRPRAGSMTLTRPLTDDTSFNKWIDHTAWGRMKDARKGAAIIITDWENKPVRRIKLINAFPSKLSFGSLKAGDTTHITEQLTIEYESLEIE